MNLNVPHRYVLFNPLTQTVMPAEHALHVVIPLDVISQGEEAILAFCSSYVFEGKYAKDLVEQGKQTS